MSNFIKRLALGMATLVVSLAATSNAMADFVSGTLFYTTFAGGQNIHKVSFNYDGASSFSFGPIVNIASTPGADGLIFAPDGDLLVGGQGNVVHKVNPTTGAFTSRTAGGVSAFHLALDPSAQKFWAMGIPGTPADIPLNPFSNGTAHPLSGQDTAITSLAFTPGGTVFYTSSGSGGIGNFGTINLSTFTTTRLLTNVAAAHGMVFDPFTGDLMLFGDSHVTQIDPSTPTVFVSDRIFGGGVNFDQGAVDGNGHAFVADNNGRVLFVDYKATGLIGSLSNFTALPFLQNALDDIAPLVGLGGPPPTNVVPEPTSAVLFVLGAMSFLGHRMRRSKKSA